MYKKRFLAIFLLVLWSLLLSGCFNQAQERVVQIASGDEFTLFLYNTGKVYAIGKNTSGQLGVGDCKDRYDLTEVQFPEPVQSIGASDNCAFALTKKGVLYTWGDNRYRQSANTSDSAVTVPARVPIKEKVKLCALGWSATYAWTESNVLYGWGYKGGLFTYNYETWKPDYVAEPLPQKLTFPILGGYEDKKYSNPNIELVSVGTTGILGIAKDGTCFCRSADEFAVPFPKGEIVKTGAGEVFNVLLTRQGSLYLWGQNACGELGNGNLAVQKEPRLLSFNDDPLKDISVGPNHILAVSKSGQIWAWGDNSHHQLGLEGAGNIMVPTVVPMPEKITAVSTGFSHSYALGQSGQLYAFGSNRYGQLRTGNQKEQIKPVPVILSMPLKSIEKVVYQDLKNETIADICGLKFLTKSGKIFTIGTTYYGKLGTNNIDTVYYPPDFIELPEKATQIDEGMYGVTILTETGQIYNFGYNENNALGHEIVKWYDVPKYLPLPEKIVKIHSGISSTAALSEKGTWYMWGDNQYGGLATGKMERVTAPVKISTPVEFADVSPGIAHTLALTSQGEVYLWGSWKTSVNDKDTLVREVSPRDLKYHKIQIAENIAKIEAGESACYALSKAGNLYIWGDNRFHELGIGDKEIQEKPIVILKDIEDFSVSPERRNILALNSQGEVYIWGETGYDKEMHLTYSYTPQKVAFSERINRIFAADNVFYAAGKSKLYTWGYNYIERFGEPILEPVAIPYK